MRLGLVALLTLVVSAAAAPVAAQGVDSRITPALDASWVMVGTTMRAASSDDAGTFVLPRKAIPAFADATSSEYVRALNSGGGKPASKVSGILLMAVPGPVLGAGAPLLLALGGLWFARRRRKAKAALDRSGL